MKDFRTIVSSTLINELGLDPVMLSRLSGDEAISIELNRGAVIYLMEEKTGFLLAILSIPLKDKRKLQFQAAKVMDFFIKDTELLLNIQENEMVLMCYIERNVENIESKLLDRLVIFNDIAEVFNE